jgi:hypothetical protein
MSIKEHREEKDTLDDAARKKIKMLTWWKGEVPGKNDVQYMSRKNI